MVVVGYTALGILGASAVLIPVALLLRQRRMAARAARGVPDLPGA